MAVPESAAQMKAWLETGDTPTQAQWANIIDTLVYQYQQALDLAQEARDIVEASSLKAFGYLKLNRPVGGPAPGDPQPDAAVLYRYAGGTIDVDQTLDSLGGAPTYPARITAEITVTFDTPQADANYFARLTVTPTQTNGAGNLTSFSSRILSKATDEVVFEVIINFLAAGGGTAWVHFEVFP